MVEKISSESIYHKQVLAFKSRFGQSHFSLLCHASVSLSTSPKLLHALRANFRTDIYGKDVSIPWEAISDILLSNIFYKAREELYETNAEFRDILINDLMNEQRFGPKRVEEVARFLISFFNEDLKSSDEDVSDTAQAQCFAALSLIDATESIRQLASSLSTIALVNPLEVCRFSLIIKSLEKTLLSCNDSYEARKLIEYTDGLSELAHNRVDRAERILRKLFDENHQSDYLEVLDVKLLFPDSIKKKRKDYSQLHQVSSSRDSLDPNFDFIAFIPPFRARVKEVIKYGESFGVKLIFDDASSLFSSIRYSGFSRGVSYPPGARYNLSIGELVSVVGRKGNFLLIVPSELDVAIDNFRSNSEGTEGVNVKKKSRARDSWTRKVLVWGSQPKADWRVAKFVRLRGIGKVDKEVTSVKQGRVDFEHGLWPAKLYIEGDTSYADSELEIVLSPGSTVEVLGRMENTLYVSPLKSV